MIRRNRDRKEGRRKERKGRNKVITKENVKEGRK